MQLVREKSAQGSDEEKKSIVYLLFSTVFETIKMLSPVAPFITEEIYQNLKAAFKLKEESVHLLKWPKPETRWINKGLENSMERAKEVIAAILSAREKSQLGVRWPLGKAFIITKDKSLSEAVEKLKALIMKQCNAKEIITAETLDNVRITIKPNFNALGRLYGSDVPKIAAHIGSVSSEKILESIESGSCFKFAVGEKEFEISKEHLIIEKELPANFSNSSVRHGEVYIDTTRTPELEAEGYARELMRRVQNARKEAGLEKSDSIGLVIEMPDALLKMLSFWKDAIKEKVGAKAIQLSLEKPSREYPHFKEEKIKDYKTGIYFEKM